jgi:hypothetical protein
MKLYRILRTNVDRNYIVYKAIIDSHKTVFDPNIFDKQGYLLQPRVHPEHLVVLDDRIAKQISDCVVRRLPEASDNKILVDLNSGAGLIAKHLINAKKFQKHTLIERNKDFLDYLIRLQANGSSSNANDNIEIIRKDPFKDNFKFQDHMGHSVSMGNLLVNALLPWTRSKVFLDKIYADYCRHLDLFDLVDERTVPEFFLIVPEFQLAHLKPEFKPEYKRFNTDLSVLCALMADLEVVDRFGCEHFFPYALDKALDKSNDETDKWPSDSNLIKNDSVYLVSMKFMSTERQLVKDKRMFHSFIVHLWSDRNRRLFEYIANLCADKGSNLRAGTVFRVLKLSLTQAVKDFHAFQFHELFDYLYVNNKEIMLKRFK